MAPASLLAARSSKSQNSGNGLSITSAVVKKGKPTVVKYSWQYHDKSPDYFTVAAIEVSTNDFVVLVEEVETRGYGKGGKGTTTISIEVLKSFPGKYVIVLIDIKDSDNVYAKSKAFQLKKSDF